MLAASLGFLSFTVEESFLVPVVAKVARSLVFDQTGPQFFWYSDRLTISLKTGEVKVQHTVVF